MEGAVLSQSVNARVAAATAAAQVAALLVLLPVVRPGRGQRGEWLAAQVALQSEELGKEVVVDGRNGGSCRR